ncbi:MAG TPA: lysine--tRNA ligase, partial [Syntrophales bacterium]|nr:lysine--tRNA ligase [Syntrophales bacterium]
MEESELIRKRKENILSLQNEGVALYPNDVRVKDNSAGILNRFSPMGDDDLALVEERFTLAGRIMAIRDFGKGAFVIIQDR